MDDGDMGVRCLFARRPERQLSFLQLTSQPRARRIDSPRMLSAWHQTALDGLCGASCKLGARALY